MRWIKTKDKLPPENEWVIVVTDDYYKPIEVMKYLGEKIGRVAGSGLCGWKEFIYPAWTSGHGDILGCHPFAWAKITELYK